jgi:colanic acid/amylovoran biosynthesis glycosyltransferase
MRRIKGRTNSGMRIAFLVTSFPTISETFILDQITGLIDLGCEVEIFAAIPDAGAIVHPEVEAYGLMDLRRLPRMPGNHALRPLRALQMAAAKWRDLRGPHAGALNLIRHGKPAASLRLFFETLEFSGRPAFDVVHCHFGPNGLRGLALRDIGALRGKLIVSFYGHDVSEFPLRRGGNPYRELFARGDLFLAISRHMHGKLLALGCDPSRIRIHPLGVKPQLFPVSRPAVQGNPVRILSIGRLVPKKGFEYGLQAVAQLIREDPTIEYLIIGDGPLRRDLANMVDNLGLDRVVSLAGWKSRPEVVSALAGTDILLAPSVTSESGDQEGTPVAIMEALACGVPVVSTFHAGVPEIVADSTSGLLVPERNVPCLADALQVLVRDPGLRARFGARGREAMNEEHDIGKLNARLLTIYRDVVAQPQHDSTDGFKTENEPFRRLPVP